MSQYNGAFGCPYCLHRGETVKTSERGHTRAYPFHIKGRQNDERIQESHLTAMTFERRTHQQTLKFAKKAHSLRASGKSSSSVKGVKGMTWSMLFSGFDIINGVTIDYMHCILLGITKMLLTLWTDKSYSANPWHVGSDKLKKLEERYLAIKPQM
ncbi:unnamed protein product [Porites evermanni]|uniref:Uncharacterized protein n=1 Tax=Porites evermanni TaxID=104178 RepID=A0ABN8M826_9CNID|nr:unnamed protein product [Porites evermanni]